MYTNNKKLEETFFADSYTKIMSVNYNDYYVNLNGSSDSCDSCDSCNSSDASNIREIEVTNKVIKTIYINYFMQNLNYVFGEFKDMHKDVNVRNNFDSSNNSILDSSNNSILDSSNLSISKISYTDLMSVTNLSISKISYTDLMSDNFNFESGKDYEIVNIPIGSKLSFTEKEIKRTMLLLLSEFTEYENISDINELLLRLDNFTEHNYFIFNVENINRVIDKISNLDANFTIVVNGVKHDKFGNLK